MKDKSTHLLEKLLARDHRFTIESYRFVLDALTYAQKQVAHTKPGKDEEQHVSGQDLSAAVRDLALEQFGYMARVILARLGIRRTSDIGDIVYGLIEIGFMNKVPEDTREDFDNVFDLAAELDAGFSFRQ